MNSTKTLSKTTLTLNPEFAHEIVLGVPYAYWLHQQGLLEKVVTGKGMKPFYYFCDNVEEDFSNRTLDNVAAGLNQLPNNWIHHNAEAVFGVPHHEMTLEQQEKANGVLDYSQWTPPPYSEFYKSNLFDKPYVVINNMYNIEFGRNTERPLRTFDIEVLYKMFVYFNEKQYIVIYKRPKNTEFTIDQNEMNSLNMKLDLTANVNGVGLINDYDLCAHFDNVYTLDEMVTDKSYNETQLEIFSGASGFVTPNGGGGILCAYFGKPIVMYVPDGRETRPGYLTNENSYIKKLSNADVYPIFDNPRETGVSNYNGVLDKIKQLFK